MKKRKLMKEKQKKIKLLNVKKKKKIPKYFLHKQNMKYYKISQYSNIIIVIGN